MRNHSKSAKYALSQKTRVTLYSKKVLKHKTIYEFVRNLGHADLERAKIAYPNAEVNLNLRGRRIEVENNSNVVSISTNSDVTWKFGPYFGRPISECDNAHHLCYCMWFKLGSLEEQEAMMKRAIEIGCVKVGDMWWAPQDIGSKMYNIAVENAKKNKGIASLLESGKEVTIDMDSNISLDGTYTNSTKYGSVVFEFPFVYYPTNSHAIEHSYIQDLKSGKGKKTKGKQVKITKYSYKSGRVKCTEYQIIK